MTADHVPDILRKKILLRPDEVAELISMSDDTVRKLVDEGKLEGHAHNGLQAKPLLITARSVVIFVRRHALPWDEPAAPAPSTGRRIVSPGVGR
jgi:excisionase family DNA binding protein